ncbi:hypothetical protein KR059_004593, partial [Drosophila kikkawai]
SDDKNVLLEDDCYKIIELDIEPGNNEENDNEIEILEEEVNPSYRFLQNCNSVALWICVLYNLCIVVLLVFIFVYKKFN